jgi:hypothetical protein
MLVSGVPATCAQHLLAAKDVRRSVIRASKRSHDTGECIRLLEHRHAHAGYGVAWCREETGELPASLELFIRKLPKALEIDQPVPDIDYIIGIIMRSNMSSYSNGHDDERLVGSKRSFGVLTHSGASGATSDIFHLRHQQRVAHR